MTEWVHLINETAHLPAPLIKRYTMIIYLGSEMLDHAITIQFSFTMPLTTQSTFLS